MNTNNNTDESVNLKEYVEYIDNVEKESLKILGKGKFKY